MRVFFLILLGLIAIPFCVNAAPWQIDYAASKIEFTAKYAGSDINGSFEKFAADIVFDPAHLDKSAVRVEIPTSSIQTNYTERDQTLIGSPWFDAAKFPVAVYAASNFKKIADNKYRADGTLTIKGIQKNIGFDFEFPDWQENADAVVAVMKSNFIISRNDFNIGEGEWASEGMVANAVAVRLNIAARLNKKTAH